MSTFELAHLDSDSEHCVLVSLEGELDLTNVGRLDEAIEDACPPESALVVDLNRVTFIDSAALHCFFRLARLRGRTRLALVVDPVAPIARALGIVDLGAVATVARTVDEARAGLNGTRTD